MTIPPIGVVDIVYERRGDVVARAAAAAADGYAHIDPVLPFDPGALALPVGCPTAFPKPLPTWCATPAPDRTLDRAWERAVRWWRAAPQALLEPWAGAVVCSAETAQAFRAEVPGVRLLVDTGHVADWGGDPCELLDLADHVQLRQGAPGHAQLPFDDHRGAVDFAAVFARLRAIGYAGRCSVEYFDLPARGWPCAAPETWARDLAEHCRGLH